MPASSSRLLQLFDLTSLNLMPATEEEQERERENDEMRGEDVITSESCAYPDTNPVAVPGCAYSSQGADRHCTTRFGALASV